MNGLCRKPNNRRARVGDPGGAARKSVRVRPAVKSTHIGPTGRLYIRPAAELIPSAKRQFPESAPAFSDSVVNHIKFLSPIAGALWLRLLTC